MPGPETVGAAGFKLGLKASKAAAVRFARPIFPPSRADGRFDAAALAIELAQRQYDLRARRPRR